MEEELREMKSRDENGGVRKADEKGRWREVGARRGRGRGKRED